MNATNYKQISITIILAGLMLLLASCCIADRVVITVTNENSDHSNVCSGGLQATFQAGNLTIQSPKVKETEFFEKVVSPLPSGVGVGTLVTVEAWCYDADTNKPTGYIRVEERWRYDSVNSVLIYPLALENRNLCIRGVEERAPVPCINSLMLKDYNSLMLSD